MKYYRELGTNRLLAENLAGTTDLTNRKSAVRGQPSVVNVNNIYITLDADSFAKANQGQAQGQS
ncbi:MULTISPECIES: hypothetical protein [Sutcliffiella]|uniref:Uncharacterized protein n=1 Tax=Sutcliffiella cohnii TaxID=33932 RepID=A0A223KME4_9BACI|nr:MULTISPECIES: hypothetical protein [Sutcliffiella]AST90632.1 hypothetical protein BC6307_04725 [Sutcliffiella cohnii]MED4016920.1 hypothetical protein [Sutcliffiella cohnii]WBL16284.1 hypothetical protein O1A01_06540 [Sutcliffiella sp. NC1]